MTRVISEAIAALASTDATVQRVAAEELFRRGEALAESAVNSWLADAELAGLFLGDQERLRATVGIAVRPETFAKIRAACSFPRLASVPPELDAEEFEMNFPGCARLDILTTNTPQGDGAITRYLEKFGEGIQQVEFAVSNVDRATELLQTRFAQSPIYPQTRLGAEGTRVNFFLVTTPEGRKVLVELVETPRG